MIKNPKALRFNLAKKLCQLMRVIEAFSEQMYDREYQEQLLYEKYDPLILQSINSYNEKAAPVAAQLEQDRVLLEQEIDSDYRARVDALRTDLADHCASAVENVDKFQEKVIEDIEKIMNEINLIKSRIEERQTAIESLCDERRARIAESARSARERMKQEVLNHDDEASRRISELHTRSEAALAALRDAHEKEKRDTITDFENNKRGLDSMSKLQTLKTKILNVRESLISTRANAEAVITSQNEKTRVLRLKLEGICRGMFDLAVSRENHERESREAQAKLKEEIARRRDDAQKAKELEIMELREKLKHATQETEEKIARLHEVLEERKERMHANENSSDAEWKKLQEKHKKELQEINAETVETRMKEESELEEKKKTLAETIEKQKKEIEEARERLEKLKENLQKSLEEQKRKGEKLIDEENERFKEVKNAILEEIEAKKHGHDASARKNAGIIRELEEEIDKMNRNHEEETEKKRIEREKEESELRFELEEAQRKKKEEYEAAKLARHEKQKHDLEKEEERLHEDLKAHEVKLENEFQDALKKVSDEFSKRDEQEKLEREYEERIQKLIRKRDEIVIPSGDAEKFAALDKTIKELENKRREELERVELHEREVNNDWDAKFEAEKKRHAEKMSSFQNIDDRETEKSQLRQQITDAEKEQESTQKEFDEFIREEKEKHKRIMTDLKNRLEQSNQETDAETLRRTIEDLQRSNREEMERTKAGFAKEVEDLKQKKRREKESHASFMADIAKKMQEMEKERQETVTRITETENQETATHKTAIEKAKREKEALMQDERRKHKENIEILKQEGNRLAQAISTAKAQFEKAYTEQKNSFQSSLDEMERQTREGFEKMKQEWIGLRDFYDEKISVLKNEIQKISDLYEQRPPRPQDTELIQKLEENVNLAKSQLQASVKELLECKKLFVSQEKEYNRRFGGGPKVGTFNPQ